MTRIRFENVTKTYPCVRGQNWLRNIFQAGAAVRGRKKVLEDVSFSMREGDSYALVGRNGAGKSTLLAVIAGLLPYDSGNVEIAGGVAPMLDLGAGFHPDLTGRENLMVNSALLGLTRRQACDRMDEMIEFSELEYVIDEPLRTYSTGMVLRLSFSVATAVNRDILLIDELLAVGDAAFQAKCIERIHGMKRDGKIFVCVSHAESLGELCDKAIWLENGLVRRIGRYDAVMTDYLDSLQCLAPLDPAIA